MDRLRWPPTRPLDPSVHFRHGGRANVAWCDGRVTAAGSPHEKLGGKNSYGGDAEKWVIGWFGDAQENGATESAAHAAVRFTVARSATLR